MMTTLNSCHKVKGLKIHKKVPGMVCRRNEGKAKYRCGGRHGRNEEMESSEPERDGPMLEEYIWLREWREKSWTSTRSKRTRSGSLGMVKSTQEQEIQNEKVVRRLLGRIFSLFRENNLQRLQSRQEESTEEEEETKQEQ